MALIKIGCCGFPVSRARYFNVFETVELQQTFYQPPEIPLAKKWRKESPPEFEYTLKAWQLITHEPKSPTYRKLKTKVLPPKEKNYGSFKPTDEVLYAWEKTKEIAKVLNAKVIVFQCPPSFEPSAENKQNIKRFFSTIDRKGFTLAWEPRGKWHENEIEVVCKSLDLLYVVDPLINPPVFSLASFQRRGSYGRIFYYRLHGLKGYRYQYTDEDLLRLKGFSKGGAETYFMFNNLYMFEDATSFKRLIEGQGAGMPCPCRGSQ